MRKFIAITTAVLLSVISANAQYKMKVTLKNGQETEYKVSEIENVTWLEETVTPGDSDGVHNGHEYVDLGLPSGTKWATCNVGANSPEEYGGYYAWGETVTKDYYYWDTYAYGSEDYDCQYIGSEISGTQYDVAHVQWGGNWRMPTLAQCQELIDCCSSSWTSVNGVSGTKVVGPNGNYIFLPAAGFRVFGNLDIAGSDGFYWSGTLSNEYSDYSSAYVLDADGSFDWCSGHRCEGHSVRPVWSESDTESVKVTGISFDKSSLSLTVGNTYTLMPTVSPSDATDKSLTWYSSDPSVATVSSSGEVSAVNAGTAIITAMANDGSGVEVTCMVAVTSLLQQDTSYAFIGNGTATSLLGPADANGTYQSDKTIELKNLTSQVTVNSTSTAATLTIAGFACGRLQMEEVTFSNLVLCTNFDGKSNTLAVGDHSSATGSVTYNGQSYDIFNLYIECTLNEQNISIKQMSIYFGYDDICVMNITYEGKIQAVQ